MEQGMLSFKDLWDGLLGSFSWVEFRGFLAALLRVAVIIGGLMLAGRLGRRLIEGILRPERIPGAWDERRIHTLRGLARSVLRYTLYFVGGLMLLDEFGVPTASLLAGAGILGLAVGFGAQNLVRDVITGFFILFEDQYAVGDYVTVAGVTGTVEEIGLRLTKVREWTGELHIIPNGEIKQVTNHTRGGMGVLVEVEVAYEENLARVIEVIERLCRELAEEEPDVVLEAPRVLGVTRLGESGVTLQVFGKVRPMQQWAVARELRRRIKEAFDEAGIEIPYPRRVILTGVQGGAGSGASDAVSPR